MFFGSSRTLHITLLVFLFSFASHSGEATAIVEVFAKPIARLIFVVSGSEKAAIFMRDVTHSPAIGKTDAAYNEFRQALNWEDSHKLRSVFAEKITQIETDFGAVRKKLGKIEIVAPNEYLTDEEIIELRKIVAKALDDDQSLARLVRRTKAAIKRKIPQRNDRLRLVEETGDFKGAGTPLPDFSKDVALDVQTLDRGNRFFFRVFTNKIDDYARFGKALITTEGEWRSLLPFKIGKKFTIADRDAIHEENLILGALTQKMQLELRLIARSQVPRQKEVLLNSLTEDASIQYQRGEISAKEWIAKRLEAAGGTTSENSGIKNWITKKWNGAPVRDPGIGLTAFDIEGERIMLETLEKCRQLGGSNNGSFTQTGLINEWISTETTLRGKMTTYEKAIDSKKADIEQLKFDLAVMKKNPNIESYKVDEMNVSIKGARRELNRLVRLRRKTELKMNSTISSLNQAYPLFFESNELLSVFTGARTGEVAGQSVTPIPFPDVLIATQAEVNAWARIRDTALQNAVPDLIVSDLKLFGNTRLGATQDFIRDIDKAYSQVHGIPFTQSQLGKEYQAQVRSTFFAIGKVVVSKVLPTASTATVLYYAGRFADLAFLKWYRSLFGEQIKNSGSPAPIVVTPPVTRPIEVKPPAEHPSAFGKKED